MAETAKTPESAKSEVKATAPKLSPASESGDAAVHFLLAKRQALVSSGMSTEDVDAELAEMGLTAK